MDLKTKNKILDHIKKDLFPEVNPMTLLLRILAIHIVSTAFVMAICPQFGMGLFANGHYGLTSLFMLVSHEFCQMACGAFLTGTSAFSIWLSLKITEKEWLMNHRFILSGIVLCLTSAFFWMRAPDAHILEMSLWIVGCIAALTGLSALRSDYSVS